MPTVPRSLLSRSRARDRRHRVGVRRGGRAECRFANPPCRATTAPRRVLRSAPRRHVETSAGVALRGSGRWPWWPSANNEPRPRPGDPTRGWAPVPAMTGAAREHAERPSPVIPGWSTIPPRSGQLATGLAACGTSPRSKPPGAQRRSRPAVGRGHRSDPTAPPSTADGCQREKGSANRRRSSPRLVLSDADAATTSAPRVDGLADLDGGRAPQCEDRGLQGTSWATIRVTS